MICFEFQENCGSLVSEAKRTELVTLRWQGAPDSLSEVIPLPVPYELPPPPYSSEGHTLFLQSLSCLSHIQFILTSFSLSADVPWSWDRRYSKKDVYGQVWPRHVQLYTCQDSWPLIFVYLLSARTVNFLCTSDSSFPSQQRADYHFSFFSRTGIRSFVKAAERIMV